MQEDNQGTLWYQLTVTEVKKLLETDTTKGLDTKHVLRRQNKYGKNSREYNDYIGEIFDIQKFSNHRL